MLALLLCGLNRKTLLALSGSTAAQPAHPTKRLMPLLKRQVLDAGGVLMTQGDPSSGALYLMETGRLGVHPARAKPGPAPEKCTRCSAALDYTRAGKPLRQPAANAVGAQPAAMKDSMHNF